MVKNILVVILNIFMQYSYAQKPELSLDLGGGQNGIISEAQENSFSFHSVIGINIKKYWNAKFHTSIGFQGLFRKQNPFLSTYYDLMYSEVINLQTSFEQVELGFPLFIGAEFNKISFSAGCNFKYLLKSSLSMNPIGTYNTNQANINGKYKRESISNTAMFNDFNYAPSILIQYQINKHLKIGYQFAYDLEINPIYYYFSTYNTYYNTLLINLKP